MDSYDIFINQISEISEKLGNKMKKSDIEKMTIKTLYDRLLLLGIKVELNVSEHMSYLKER